MGIFSLFNSKEQSTPATTPTQMVTVAKSVDAIQTFNINVDYSNPVEYLNKTARGYLFGINGFFPQELNRLYHQSPLHSAIINFKKLLTVGNGYSIDISKLDGNAKISVNQLTNQFDEIINEVGMDLFIHSRICLKITWNKDNSKILKVERISPDKIHINDVDEEMKPLNYLYNWDWTYPNKYETKKFAAFDSYNKKDKVQLYMYQVESPGMKLYADPSYQSALNWVVLDSEMSQYHKANILNSLNPSILIQYYEKPGTREEKQQVLYDLNSSFAGARKTGRAMVTFSDSKDLAPSVTQMDPNKLDKTFLSLTDTIQRQICYAHQIDPQLLGLKTPGSLGNSGDFLYSFNLFNSTVIQPAQLIIECILNKFLVINGISVKVKINEPDIVKLFPTLTPSIDVKASTTPNASDIPTNDNIIIPSQIPVPINDNIKNLTTKQHQQLLRIIRQYNKEQITKDAASVLLRTGLGLSNEDIELLLNIED